MLLDFENFTIDTDRRELKSAENIIRVEPQVFDLLLYLAQHTNRVISKDELIKHVWNERIVSDAALNSRINFARRAIGDSGEKQRFIRTVPRRGFLFCANVKIRETDPVNTKLIETSDHKFFEKPSIAVLPFQNMSGDVEQEYFADGMSEDIITALSRSKWFFVISRNSSFAYKAKTIDLNRIARELGVRYVLEGSVRKTGNRVRITAQLIDVPTARSFWADRYDGDLADVFSLQDEITKRVVGAIEPRLLEAEGMRSQNRATQNVTAWDMLIQANYVFWRLTETDTKNAIAILRQLIERHPDYAPAHSMVAFILLYSHQIGWITDAQVKEAEVCASRAAELDNSEPWAHLALGYVAYIRRHTEVAQDEFRRALEINPNFAAAHGYLGCALAVDGQSGEAISQIEQAIRMSPHDPQNAMFNVGLAAAHYLAGRFKEAVSFARKAIQQRSRLTNAHRIYVASLAQAGLVDEARAALTRLQELQPENSIAWIESRIPYTAGPMQRFLEGMRKAGLH